jgi:hypothetical protein
MNKWCTDTHYTIVCVVIRVGSDNFLLGERCRWVLADFKWREIRDKMLKNDEKRAKKKEIEKLNFYSIHE